MKTKAIKSRALQIYLETCMKEGWSAEMIVREIVDFLRGSRALLHDNAIALIDGEIEVEEK